MLLLRAARRSVHRFKRSGVWAAIIPCLCLGLGASPGETAAAPASFNFEWIGKIEMDAEGLKSSDHRLRRSAVAALGKYDIAITTPYLMEALRDSNWGVRAEAGRILGEHSVTAAAPIIIEWLNEPEADIKQEAADILASLATPEAVTALIRSLGDPDDRVRQRAATALGKIGTPRVVVPLIGRLEDDKSDVRRAAISQLEKLGDRRAVIPLVRAFRDPNLEVRKAAISAVGHLDDPAAIPALLRLLRGSVEDIKLPAAVSLGNLRAAAATDMLIDELATARGTYASQVAYALGKIAEMVARQDPDKTASATQPTGGAQAAAGRAVRALVEALARRDLRPAAREALRRAGPIAVPALIAHLDGDYPGDLTTAVELLRDIGASEATPALVAELDRGRLSRQLILDALAKSGDRRALLPLLGLLSARDEDIRLRAMTALRGIIDDPRAADVLVGLLDDRNLEIRILAADYLGLMRSRRAVTKLVALTAAESPPRLRRAAVDAVGEIADPRASAAMLELLERGPASLHHNATNALIYIGDRGAVDRLVALASDPGADARPHAVRALGGILRGARSDRVRSLLETLARGRDLPLSLAAIEALSARGDMGGIRTLRALSGGGGHRRRAAATALGNLGDRSVTPVVLEALSSSDDRVSGDAAWALAKLGDPRALAPLMRATERRGWATAINAAAALARSAPASHGDKLIALLYHRNRFVRSNAAIGLARLGTESARKDLIAALRRDPSWLVRTSACRALSMLGGADAALAEAAERDRDA
ncbi:MAG: HEAT repeat domain-containing protein, partial [Myxococcota bacterium]